jgi:hypothetical protein
MSSAPPKTKDEKPTEEPKKKAGKGKLILIAVPVLLIVLGAGLWFSGVLPHLLGMDKHEDQTAEVGATKFHRHPGNDCEPQRSTQAQLYQVGGPR